MVTKTKRIWIGNEIMGRSMVEDIRNLYGDNVANKVKLINEISFNVPVYYFGTDELACHMSETNNWYLEFPEEITITD